MKLWARIPAGALQLVLFIGAVIAVLLMCFVLIAHTHSFFGQQSKQTIEVIRQAGFALEASLDASIPLGKPVQIAALSQNGIETIVERSYWGLLEQRTVRSQKNKTTFRKTALCGFQAPSRLALYLKDQNRPMVISGDARITGTAFLPQRGIKVGSIYGRAYYDTQLVYGEEKVSDTLLPRLHPEIHAQLKNLSANSYDLSKKETLTLKSGLEHARSFTADPAWIQGDHLVLDRVTLSGHIIIEATESITVRSNSVLKDVVLLAPQITIEHWTKGSFQAIASRQIDVGKGCELSYPSVLATYASKQSDNADNEGFSGIHVDNYAKVSGMLVHLGETRRNYPFPQIRIEEHAALNGEVYCQGGLQLKGKINGSAMIESFWALESGSIYHNYLYNGRINAPALDAHYAGLALQDQNANVVIKWLY